MYQPKNYTTNPGKTMTYHIVIVILCAITTSLTPMERIKRTLKRANTHQAVSKKKEKHDTFVLTPSTFFKKRLLFSYQCRQYNIPQEINQHIQQLLYASENEKLVNSGTFGTNWQEFELNPSDYHYLNEKQFTIIKDFLTSTPHHLPSQKSYRLFIHTIPHSIKTCIAEKLPDGIPVYSTTAAQADIGLYMIALTPKTTPIGLTHMPIFPKQKRKKISNK